MFPPPIHPDDLDLDAPPGSILIDPHGYISDRTNATTACGVTRGGKTVMVTFWAAQPPRGSCFTLHFPDMDPSAYMSMPQILNTVDDLALLRVPVCSEGCIVCHSLHHDYFVYHAGSESKPPSLDLIPLPPGGVNPSDPQEAETKRRPVLKGRWAGYPALSSQDDDVVYISDRYDGRDRTASVIAVDLRKQTVRDVAEFGSERPLGYSYIYLGSGISKHLPPTRGKSSEASKKEIVQAVKHDVPGKNLQSEPTSKVDGTSPK